MRYARSRRGARGHLARGVTIAALALVVALAVTLPAERALRHVHMGLSLILVGTLIVLGSAGDMLAVAVAAGEEPALHAMAVHRRPGARGALALKRRADRVVSIAGDIVGDVAGTVSGAAAAAAAVGMAGQHGWSATTSAAISVALVAAITVGLKATLKGVALRQANHILHAVGTVSHLWGWVRSAVRGGGRKGGGRR